MTVSGDGVARSAIKPDKTTRNRTSPQSSRRSETGTLSARSRGPAYLLIADAISDRIASGAYRAGDQLPTEARLREEFGVSPMTVRRAVNILLDRGLVSTTQGKGTFVRPLDLTEAVFRLEEVTGGWLADSSVDVTLLEASIRPADAAVAEVLGLPSGTPTVFLRRLLSREGAPFAYQLEHVVYDEHRPLVEGQLKITSLDGLLRAAGGERLPRGWLRITAVGLDGEAAAMLQEPAGAPALRLEHVFQDFDGRPVSWGWFLCRADQFQLTTRIGAVKMPGEPA